MNIYKAKWGVPLAALLTLFIFVGCKNNPSGNKKPDSDCYVQLFDGDHYTDDSIIVKGPGEFNTLENLPDASQDWNDEADSFKSGENTTVTMWTETNFKGDSTMYKQGAEKPSVDEPSSMKIQCSESK
jgi:hypothetical protein